MVNAKRHNGFSLIEVLFAVMVLTMGLIFTASQFPIGLMTSRQVTETTLHAVESRNAEVMMQLQTGQIPSPLIGNNDQYVFNTSPGVYYWCQPNIRIDDGAIVVDDPADRAFGIDPNPDDYYLPGASVGAPPINIIPPHIKGHQFTGPTDANGTPAYNKGYLAPENIGRIVLPQVSGYDSEVVRIMTDPDGYNYALPFNDTETRYNNWQNVILGIALERSYSQAMFYKKIDPAATSDNRYQVWIFTLSNTNKESVYAMQDPTSFGTDDPFSYGLAADRRFPVPWNIQFVQGVSDTDRIEMRYVTNNDTDIEYKLMEIFRKDSYILDSVNGQLYKIISIETDNDGYYWLRLDRWILPTQTLQTFWIFPPAIIRGEGFAETQPVVNVTETTINF